MIPEKAKAGIEELSREALIALVYELMGKLHDLEEKLRLKETPPASKNSSQPPSRDFKPEQKRKRRRKKGAKAGHEKHERALVDKPDKVIEVYVSHGLLRELSMSEKIQEAQLIIGEVTNKLPSKWTLQHQKDAKNASPQEVLREERT